MIIGHMRDPARSLPEIEDPDDVTAMRLWHCRYRTLTPLSYHRKLKALVVATWSDSLEVLRPLTALRYLYVVHMPKVTSLEPLGDLVVLETRFAWRRCRLGTACKYQ